MRRKKGFSLLEIIIVMTVTGILAVFAVRHFTKDVEKAQSIEAYVLSDAIKKGEEFHKHQTGNYIALDNTEEINEQLLVGIRPKFYEFQVILPEEDKFLIIARRIGEEIEISLDGGLPKAPDLIVMGNEGPAADEYKEYITEVIYAGAEDESDGGVYNGGSEGLGLGGSSSRGGAGGSGGGGFDGGGNLSGGGSSGGGGSGGSSGGFDGSGGRGGDGDSGDDDDNTGVGSIIIPPAQTFDSDILGSLNLLNGTTAGQYYYNLIQAKQISVIFDDFSQRDLPGTVLGFWLGTAENTIFINQALKTSVPESVIASIITHEAVHADYSYNPEKMISETLARHPELTRDDLSLQRDVFGDEIIFDVYDPEIGTTKKQVNYLNSLDQEYTSFANELELWSEIKGDDAYFGLDHDLALYEQGEAELKADLRTRGSYVSLPEF